MCRSEITSERVPNEYGFFFLFVVWTSAFSLLELLALSNLAGTTDVRRALCSDSTSKKKRISNANTGKRHVVSNLTSTLTELVDGVVAHWLTIYHC